MYRKDLASEREKKPRQTVWSSRAMPYDPGPATAQPPHAPPLPPHQALRPATPFTLDDKQYAPLTLIMFTIFTINVQH